MTGPTSGGFDLHGIVGVALENATPADEAIVRRQLGPLPALDREADITIEFVDRLGTSGPIHYIGLDDAGFVDDTFLVLRARHKSRARVALPLDRLGDRLRIRCERGVPAVPLLLPLINLTALSHGVVPLHASAFVHEGVGILATGWAKGGKTEALLSFMTRGASYVGDEWVYLTPEGRMLGIPEPIRLWSWQLTELDEYRATLSRTDRLRLRALAGVADAGAALAGHRSAARSRPGRLAARLTPLVRSQTAVQVPPHRLFGEERCRASATLDRVVLMVSTEGEETTARPIRAEEVAARMAPSNAHERLDLSAALLKHRYAFPGRSSDFLDRLDELESQALRRVLHDRPAVVVRHPYPVVIRDLYDVIWPAVRSPSDGATQSA